MAGSVKALKAMASVARYKANVFADLHKKPGQIRRQTGRLRQIDKAGHDKLLLEAVDRFKAEPKGTRFFALPMGMLAIAGFDGRLIDLNSGWERTIGFTKRELTSKRFVEFAHAGDQVQASKGLARVRSSLETGYFENRFCCKDGSIRWLAWTAAPLAAEKLFYIFAGDISVRKQAEQQIEDLCQEFQQDLVELTGINKQLETFNYSVSHDLRVPLWSIRGFTHAVLEDHGPQLAPGVKSYLEQISESAKYMDAMLLALLDYSRLSQSKCKPVLLNLEAGLNEVLAQFRGEISAKKVVVEIQSPLARAWGHAPILNQILANLVDNALKFTQENVPPHIRIWTEPNGNRIRLFVEDNGLGIAPAHQQRVFNLFVRLQQAPSHPGTGVGLALVRKGAERMGGRVGVESQWGKGSRFWLELDGEVKGGAGDIKPQRKLLSGRKR